MTTSITVGRDLRERIAAIAASTLRVPVSSIGPYDTFASLGMDSLAAVELIAAIEDELEVELPLTLVHEHPTLDALCRFVEGDVDGATASLSALLRADAALPSEIAPTFRRTVSAGSAAHILVTGATGFLGAHLLRALLDHTTATVHCLVRSTNDDAPDRIRRNLAKYGIRLDDDADRIVTVRGDLTRPLLGLDARAFRELARRVDVIYHAAAAVNWVHSYHGLRDANVIGTRELVRLACCHGARPFHFVSSTSVCHPTSGPPEVDEDTDVFADIDRLHLGYAQTKCVAEALVREAGARGLPVSIVRPSLITGDARLGRTNSDDLTSRFIAGCIRMGAAPDLDWRLDCVPADAAAAALVRLTLRHDCGTQVHHIAAKRPRHWRECVLWMRLRGYDISLLPYDEWAEQLRRTTDANHPLFALRSFFLHRLEAENHLTLPELFEESRRSRLRSDRSARTLDRLDAHVPDVDSSLLALYFDDFVRVGLVPPTRRERKCPPSPATRLLESNEALEQGLNAWLGGRARVERVSIESAASDESIVAELTAWRGGNQAGLFRAKVAMVDERGGRRDVPLFVKAKSPDAQSIDVAVAVAQLASPPLGHAMDRFRNDIGLTQSHVRELAVYGLDDVRLRSHVPRPVVIERDDARQRWILALEPIDDAVLLNANDPARWDATAIEAALSGLARIHSAWLGRGAELATRPWLAPRRDAAKLVEMTPLWSALAEHAHARSLAFADRRLHRIHEWLIEDVASWAAALERAPGTLIHNDFNPRNVALRRVDGDLCLCAFDWELAAVGAPQRDLAEFLTFVLPPDASLRVVVRWVERYRSLLSAESGVALPPDEWDAGFSAALCEFLVDRLASYAMIDRVRRQSFLPRVVQSWLNVFAHFPWTK